MKPVGQNLFSVTIMFSVPLCTLLKLLEKKQNKHIFTSVMSVKRKP